MQKTLLSIACCLILVAGAAAQSGSGGAGSAASGAAAQGGAASSVDSTQIAYKLLASWADNGYAEARRDRAIAAGVVAGTGGLLLGSAAVTWFAGDEISRSATGAPMNADLKLNLSLGLGAGGLALAGAGAIVAAVPVQDPHLVWTEVFNETNADLREAMAVSALRSLAQQGKERRIASFITSFLVPILSGGIQVGINLSQDRVWSTGLLQSLGSSSWSIAAGITGILSTSPEERLYERYLVARSAYSGGP